MEKKDKENIGLKPIIVEYLRHWKLILGVGVFSLIVAVLYLVLYPNTYETMARIQIQEESDLMSSGSIGLGEAAGLMKSFGLGSMASKGGISIDDEISTLYSSRLMSEMVTQLGLYAEYTNTFMFWYKMYGEEPVKVTCDSILLSNLDESIEFKVSVSDGGKIKIKSKTDQEKHTFQFESFPAVVELKQGRFIFTKNPILSQSSFSVNVEVFPPSWIAEYLVDEVLIEDYSKSSNMIELSCKDYKKQRAKDMLNTLIALYNKKVYSYKKELGDLSISFLDGRIESVINDLNLVEKSIEHFKEVNRITDVEFDIQYYADYMKDLKMKTIELETQTGIIKLMDEFIKDPANKYKLVPSLLLENTDSEGSPLFLYNKVLMERERAIKSSSEDNPMVANLTSQADQLRESVYQMIDNAQQNTILTRKSMESKERDLTGKMESVPKQERTYINYKRQQEILQGVYLILLQKREEVALSIGQDIDKAKIIDAAFIKKKPVAPRKLYAAIGLIIMTFIISVFYLFLKNSYKSIKEEYKRAS